MDTATKSALAFILKRQIRVMQSDLKFGNYSEEAKQIIVAQLDAAIKRYTDITKD